MKRNSKHSLAFFSTNEKRTEIIGLILLSHLVYFILANSYTLPILTEDSAGYISSAVTGKYGGYRPFGYSFFMRILGSFSKSWHFFSYMQFCLHLLSTLVFCFTIESLFKAQTRISFFIFSFLVVCSESLIFMNFWIMSDSIYFSLTLLWLSSLIWLLQTRKLWILVFNTLLLFSILKIRLAAVDLPFIAIVLMIGFKKRAFILPIALNLAVVLIVYFQGIEENKQSSGVNSFSPFSGWVLANNATSILPYVTIDTAKFDDPDVKKIHTICTAYPDTFFNRYHVLNTSFIWHNGHAGKAALMEYYHEKQHVPYIKCWAQMGEKMQKYGKGLIMQQPFEYVRRFIFWNACRYFQPTHSFQANTSLEQLVNIPHWFVLPKTKSDEQTTKVDTVMKSISKIEYQLSLYMAFLALFVISINRNRFTAIQKQVLLIIFAFTFLSSIFLILAHPIHLRYVMVYYPIFISLIYIAYNYYRYNGQNYPDQESRIS